MNMSLISINHQVPIEEPHVENPLLENEDILRDAAVSFEEKCVPPSIAASVYEVATNVRNAGCHPDRIAVAADEVVLHWRSTSCIFRDDVMTLTSGDKLIRPYSTTPTNKDTVAEEIVRLLNPEVLSVFLSS